MLVVTIVTKKPLFLSLGQMGIPRLGLDVEAKEPAGKENWVTSFGLIGESSKWSYRKCQLQEPVGPSQNA